MDSVTALQLKAMRARLEAIAAQIEDSEYFGRVASRGAPKLLTEIAASCRVTLDMCDNITKRGLLRPDLPKTREVGGVSFGRVVPQPGETEAVVNARVIYAKNGNVRFWEVLPNDEAMPDGGNAAK